MGRSCPFRHIHPRDRRAAVLDGSLMDRRSGAPRAVHPRTRLLAILTEAEELVPNMACTIGQRLEMLEQVQRLQDAIGLWGQPVRVTIDPPDRLQAYEPSASSRATTPTVSEPSGTRRP